MFDFTPPHITLLLPGSLPPAHQIPFLLPYAQQKTPTLFRWLKSAPRTPLRYVPPEIPCTNHEYFLLQEMGFTAAQPKAWASAWLGFGGMGGAVWQAYPCHMSVGQDITIQPIEDLTTDEASALLQSIQPTLNEYQHQGHIETAQRWGWEVPPDFQHTHCSLDALMQAQAWRAWSSDPASAAWRRLLNDIQIIWHHHPVNHQRQEQGKEPVNMLWLMGEARPWQPAPIRLVPLATAYHHLPNWSPAAAEQSFYIDTTLRLHALNDDWGAWLEHWQTIEQTYLHPLEQAYQKKTLQSLRILLSDEERYGIIEHSASTIRWIRPFQTYLHAGRQPLWWSLP